MKVFRLGVWLVPVLFLMACGTLPIERGEGSPDQALAHEVRRRLQDSGIAQAGLVGVTAESGVVTLYGSVEEAALRMQIENIARATPGVGRIESRWTR